MTAPPRWSSTPAAPADNASGGFSGQAHISRRGRPGLRLAVWRAVWPLLRHNPVMAAKYAALTGAASRRRPRPERERGSAAAAARARVACAASLLRWIYFMTVHDAAWDAAAASGAPATGGRLTSGLSRTPATGVLSLPPGEGDSEPAPPSGTNPADNPGQLSPAPAFSPARLNAVGAGLPARPRAGRARLHYVGREGPGATGQPRPRRSTPLSARNLSMPPPGHLP